MAKCEYPDDEWGKEFLAHLKAPIRHLPSDWRSKLDLPAPPDEADECKQLAEIVLLRPKYQAVIETEARSRIDAVDSVLMVINPYGPPIRSQTLQLVRIVLDEVLAPTFLIKRAVRRGRPRQCCEQPLDPMFRFTPLDPLHPAWPSGHATQAHAVAAALAILRPDAAADLRRAAGGVAFRREVAGVHYPSDSAGGAALGEQLVGMLAAMPTFHAAWIEPAMKEW